MASCVLRLRLYTTLKCMGLKREDNTQAAAFLSYTRQCRGITEMWLLFLKNL